MESIYHRLGEQNLRVMVDNFYHYVMEDDTINHLFTTDMELVKKINFATKKAPKANLFIRKNQV